MSGQVIHGGAICLVPKRSNKRRKRRRSKEEFDRPRLAYVELFLVALLVDPNANSLVHHLLTHS